MDSFPSSGDLDYSPDSFPCLGGFKLSAFFILAPKLPLDRPELFPRSPGVGHPPVEGCMNSFKFVLLPPTCIGL